MKIEQLEQEQIDELKMKVFYNTLEENKNEFGDDFTKEIQEQIEDAQYFNEIENNTIFALFSHITFCEEDFSYNLNSEEIHNIAMKMEIECENKNIDIKKVILYYFAEKMNLSIQQLKILLKENYSTLWDIQPTIEENEEVANAIQNIRELLNILIYGY